VVRWLFVYMVCVCLFVCCIVCRCFVMNCVEEGVFTEHRTFLGGGGGGFGLPNEEFVIYESQVT